MQGLGIKPALASQLSVLTTQLDQPAELLATRLVELAEQFQEEELTGIGELLTLISELVAAEDEVLEHNQQAILTTIFSASKTGVPLSDLVAILHNTLTGAVWQQPLTSEDMEMLPELLADDWQYLLEADGRNAARAEDAFETPVAEPVDDAPSAEPIDWPDSDLSSLMTDLDADEIDTPDTETALALDLDFELDLEDNTDANESTTLSGGPAATLLSRAEDVDGLSEQLAELGETLDSPLVADLVAFSSELCSTLDGLDSPLLPELMACLDRLLAQPDHAHASATLTLLGDARWPEPLDADDLDEQQALIDQAFIEDSPDAGIGDTPEVLDDTAKPAVEAHAEADHRDDIRAEDAFEMPVTEPVDDAPSAEPIDWPDSDLSSLMTDLDADEIDTPDTETALALDLDFELDLEDDTDANESTTLSGGPAATLLSRAEDVDGLSEQLAELGETLDSPLVADLVAFSSELCSTLDGLDSPLLPELMACLDRLLAQPDHAHASATLTLLGDARWPEPLDADDLDEQQALIDQAFIEDSPDAGIGDTPEVLDDTAKPAVEAHAEADHRDDIRAEDAFEMPVTEPVDDAPSAEPIDWPDSDLSSLMTDLDADEIDTPNTETALALDLDFELDLEDDTDANESTTLSGGPAATLLSRAEDVDGLSEQLAELGETLDSPLVADLVAFSSELCSTLDGLDSPLLPELMACLDRLLAQPDHAHASATLTLLGDARWPEPLDADDLDEQQALIDETFVTEELAAADNASLVSDMADSPCDASVDTEPATDPDDSGIPATSVIDTVESSVKLQAESVMPAASAMTDPKPGPDTDTLHSQELPEFCDVDMSLLEHSGPKVDPQILQMLTGALQHLTQMWEQTEPNSNPALLEASQDALRPLERACETVHLTGIRMVLEGLGLNLGVMSRRQRPLDDYEHAHFTRCLEALQAHLSALSEKGLRDELIDAISDPGLALHATPQQAAFLTGLLALAGIQAPEDIERQTATAQDVDLAIADDIDPQLLEMLYDELPVLVDEFQQHLQAVLNEQQIGSLLSAQRAAHTIKGLANMAGIRGLAKLTHCMEDVLEILTDAKTLPGPQMSEDLTEAIDCLAQMSESISESEPSPEGAQDVLQSMMDWFYRLRTEGLECASQPLSGKVRRPARKPEPATSESAPAAAETGKPKPATTGHEQSQLRVPVSLLDNLFRIAGESSTLSAQQDDRIKQMHKLARATRERQRSLQRVMIDIEQQLQDYFTLNHEDDGDSHFDPLEMDRYHSMHTSLSQLQEAVADVREVDREVAEHLRQLTEMHAAQTNLQKESLDNVLNTRQVPVRSLSSRMQRIMRQASRAAGKEARLVIEGEEVLIDSQVLNQLADPLMHIIRNAVDHGLEPPEQRARLGKDEMGTLTIGFRQADNQVQVSCSDDGSGINVQRVREIAERKGLLQPDRVLTDNEAQRLILIPGFSTRDQISQLSGRGIGMDVVYQQVTRLQGTISIHSVQGEGTRFDLSLPASSLLVHTLMVRSSHQRLYALSSHTIEQSLLSTDGTLRMQGDKMTFSTEDGEYPAYTLESLMGEQSADYGGKRLFPILMIKLDQGEKAAVLVPELLAHRQQVFKPMGEHLPDIAGVPGVTILSDGSVAPIVDLQGRIRQRHSALSPVAELAEPEFNLHLPEVLVVDDSLSARKTLATLLSDSGYEVRTAIDGLDALDKIRQQPPAIILTDLEMPRMSGMELAAILRNSKLFRHIPVVMITSRSTRKHRGEAEAAGVSAYLTKPWTEAQVLDQIQALLF